VRRVPVSITVTDPRSCPLLRLHCRFPCSYTGSGLVCVSTQSSSFVSLVQTKDNHLFLPYRSVLRIGRHENNMPRLSSLSSHARFLFSLGFGLKHVHHHESALFGYSSHLSGHCVVSICTLSLGFHPTYPSLIPPLLPPPIQPPLAWRPFCISYAPTHKHPVTCDPFDPR